MAKHKGDTTFKTKDIKPYIDTYPRTTNNIALRSDLSYGVALRLLLELEKEGFIKNLSSGEKHKISLWMLKIEREKKKYGAIDKL